MDEDLVQEYTSFEYENRKKKNRRKRKDVKSVLINNPKDTRAEDSNVDAASDIECEDESPNVLLKIPTGLNLDGFRYAAAARGDDSEPNFSSQPSLKPEPLLSEGQLNSRDEELELEEPSEASFNEKALSRYAETYELEKFKKNALLIFNQEDIDDEPRHGTHTDVEALRNTFEKFGFEVKDNIHHDLTRDEIFSKVEEFTTRDFTEYGCVGVAVLTHGSRYGRLRAKDKPYSEIEIINHLKINHNKRSLVTKPKFLIIQACRGIKIKPAVPVLHSGMIRTDTDTDLEPYHLPEEADMLILHSCYVGTPSLRHEIDGSWFIQSLCKTIDKLAHSHDLESIITEVKRVVAIDRYQQERETLPVQMCQMPVMTSTLIRKLFLKKYGDPSPVQTGLVLPVTGVEAPMTRKDSLAQEQQPPTPLLPQFGPCSCFLDHFNYMRDCLRHFVEDNPDDGTAKLHLDLADVFEDKVEYNTQKQKMLWIIHDHLKTKAKEFEYYKYMYFCINKF